MSTNSDGYPSTNRLAELVGGLAVASAYASALPPEKVMRTCVLAVEVARRVGLGDDAVRDAYYVSLLRYLGCVGFAHEEAHDYGGGDDLVVRNVMAIADAAQPVDTLTAIGTKVARTAPLGERLRAIARLLHPDALVAHAQAQCETSIRLAKLLGMSERITRGLEHVCERYDGRGAPARLSGDEIAESARIHHFADVIEIVHHRAGREAALHQARVRRGKHLDPRLCDALARDEAALFEALEAPDMWVRFLDAEPAPHVTADEAHTDEVAFVFGLFADLKSPWFSGHSAHVARLAEGAARALGLDASSVRELRQAALLHDVGRVSVPNGIWDKPGPLGVDEWERVRLHAHYTERVLVRIGRWRRVARIAGRAHERLDGEGYPRGLVAPGTDATERVLAAADVLAALLATRPHRAAVSLERAAALMREEVAARRLDAEAARAVLEAAGAEARIAKPAWPCRLTDREVEVLRWVARGKSNREIGLLLGISARTVQNHVANAYEKAGVYSRAGAALFMMEHGLSG